MTATFTKWDKNKINYKGLFQKLELRRWRGIFFSDCLLHKTFNLDCSGNVTFPRSHLFVHVWSLFSFFVTLVNFFSQTLFHFFFDFIYRNLLLTILLLATRLMESFAGFQPFHSTFGLFKIWSHIAHKLYWLGISSIIFLFIKYLLFFKLLVYYTLSLR